MKKMATTQISALLAISLLCLASCGGGGGSSNRVVTPPSSFTGSMRVTANVSGGRVIIDGISTGTTVPPGLTATISGVNVGAHTVTIQQSGYTTPAAQTVSVVKGQTVSVSFTMIPSGNSAPVADAGEDRTVYAATTYGPSEDKQSYVARDHAITLDGSASSDPDGDSLTYAWTQTAGTSVSLSSSSDATTTFVPASQGEYRFQLTVNDGYRDSAANEVVINAVRLNGKLAISLYVPPSVDIWTVNADGSGLARVTTSDKRDENPKWSADGNEIVYAQVEHEWSRADIYVINADGTNERRLTNRPEGYDYYPDFSPDGSKIVFSTDRWGPEEIAVMDSDGGNVQRLTYVNSRSIAPQFSPSGDKIVFMTAYDSINYEIMVMDADGSNVVRLTNNSEYDSQPTWYSNNQIVFQNASTPLAQEEYLYKMDADGANVSTIADLSNFTNIDTYTIDPQNSYLFVRDYISASDYSLKVISFDGSTVLDYGLAGVSPDYHPGP